MGLTVYVDGIFKTERINIVSVVSGKEHNVLSLKEDGGAKISQRERYLQTGFNSYHLMFP